MKLLFDHNLSPRLVRRLADLFPASEHVYHVSMDQASDEEVWEYARSHNIIIVTKDADFSELATLRGFPPKVIWLRLGNCATAEIEAVLRSNFESVRVLAESGESVILTLA